MKYPQLNITKQTAVSISRFPGYDHRAKAASGAVFEGENLSLRRYPMLSPRPPRWEMPLEGAQGLIAKDALCYVSGGTLYMNHRPTAIQNLSEGEKQLVSMGAYVLIFPDKLYYNTADPADFGSMEALFDYTGPIGYAMCDAEGEILENIAETEPQEPENGSLWLSEGQLLEYSALSGLWVSRETVYTRLSFSTMGQLPRLFSRYDGVETEGLGIASLNGSHVIYALGGSETEQDYMVLVGLCEKAFTDNEGSVSIKRLVPDMDHVCQCQNRLWGCRYGNDGTKNINELYCSALGDFKNFSQFLGLSTDSWRASVGSDGVFTGAVSFMDSPCFFKEDRIHRVTISSVGAHRVSETVCRGVQKGSHKSLAVVGESLFYKSDSDICLWQGGFPSSVSAPLGEEKYRKAVAGSAEGQYFVSMEDSEGQPSLFVYDSNLRLWQRQDGLRALCFASSGSCLYCLDAEKPRLLELTGNSTNSDYENGGKFTREEGFDWCAVTGRQDFETAQRKHLSRYNLSLGMAEGARLRLSLRYDSEGDWESAGEVEMKERGAVLLPVRPRRCHHVQLKLEGRGDVTLYSISLLYEDGSDI